MGSFDVFDVFDVFCIQLPSPSKLEDSAAFRLQMQDFVGLKMVSDVRSKGVCESGCIDHDTSGIRSQKLSTWPMFLKP